MHQQLPPPSNHGAANEDVMAAIAAATASEEQTAATEAVQKRQQHAQPPTPPQLSTPPQSDHPQAIPQPPAITPPQITPQPSPPANPQAAVPPPLAMIPSPRPVVPADSFAPPTQFPENLVLRNQPYVAPQPEQQVSSPRKNSKRGLAIILSLVAMVCFGIGGAFIWHTIAKSPATTVSPPAQPGPIPASTPSEPLGTSDDHIVIPVTNIPRR